jgi:hypothetical protein
MPGNSKAGRTSHRHAAPGRCLHLACALPLLNTWVTAELRDTGRVVVNHKRVARLMHPGGIVGVRLRKKVRTTIPAPDQIPVADLIRRDFTAPKPNPKYVDDFKRRCRH